jgi:hypothetical protein
MGDSSVASAGLGGVFYPSPHSFLIFTIIIELFMIISRSAIPNITLISAEIFSFDIWFIIWSIILHS